MLCAPQSQVLNKKEVEDLLRRGAYGAIMDEDNAADKYVLRVCDLGMLSGIACNTHVYRLFITREVNKFKFLIVHINCSLFPVGPAAH